MKRTSEDIFEPEIPVVPPGWDVLPFERAADVVSDRGKRVKQGSYLPTGTIPVIDQGQETIGGYTNDKSMAFGGELPVILFGDHTRSVKFVDKNFAVGAEGVKILRPSYAYVPKFFYYLLRSLQIPSRGYSRHFQFLRKFHLPLAPEEQQKNIVAEIEKQFSRLDEAVASLTRVKANFRRYKAAVLKAAVEGNLTEVWRKQNPDIEPASKLLERILAERRAKRSGKGKYKDPSMPDTSGLHQLPEGWVWATVDQITENFDGQRVPLKSTDRDQRPGPYPYYGASGVIDGIDDFLFDGHFLLIAEDGANLLSRSTPISFKASGKFWVNNHAHVVQTLGGIPLGYLESFLNGQDLKFSITGSAQPKLTQASLNDIPVPLAPLAEQGYIVAEVERRLSVIEELEAAVEVNLTRADPLRQSVLAKAFSGRLTVSESQL